MGIEVLIGMNEEDASKLMDRVRERLKYNGGLISAAVFEVLEIEAPGDISPLELERGVLGDSMSATSDSYSADS